MKNFFRFAFLTVAIFGVLQRCAHAGVVKLGDGSSGSVYRATGTATSTVGNFGIGRVNSFVVSGGSGQTLFNQTQGANGGGGATSSISYDFQFTVPNGATWTVRIMKWDWVGPSSSGDWETLIQADYTGTTGSWTPGAPGAGTNKKISPAYTNTSATEGQWIGITRTDQPGMVFQVKYVGPGETYSGAISVPGSDTGSYQLVAVDADAAFVAGGGSVPFYEHTDGSGNTYDFEGYTTDVGGALTAATNGVAGGQSRNPGMTIGTVSGTPVDMPAAAVNNPRYRSPASGAAISTTAEDSVKNTNAITGALGDLTGAIQSGISVTVTPTDMSATNAKLDTINNTLGTANTKADTLQSSIAGIATTQVSTNTKLDTINTSVTGSNTKLDTLNTTVAAGNTLQGTANTSLAAIATGQASVVAGSAAMVAAQAGGNGLLSDIKTSTDGLGGKLDTANAHLDALQKFTEGTAASQTSYSNSTQISAATSAASGVTPYAGKKATVGGALSSSIPGSVTDWGPALMIGTTSITFGIGHMSPTQDALMVAGRSVLLIAMCLGFCKASSGLVTKYTIAMPQVLAQDTGFGPENIGPGVSQGKTYATAGVAVSIIFSGCAVIVGTVDTFVSYYGGGITSIFAALNFPAASMAGALDRFVPLAAGLGLTVLGVALPYVIAPMYLGTAAILRFIKT